MSMNPSVAEWNFQCVAVMQALAGAISPNFRRVTLDFDGGEWVISFVLEQEDALDREEIEDFVDEWEALQSGPVPVAVHTWIDSGVLPLRSGQTRTIFRRRETPALDQ